MTTSPKTHLRSGPITLGLVALVMVMTSQGCDCGALPLFDEDGGTLRLDGGDTETSDASVGGDSGILDDAGMNEPDGGDAGEADSGEPDASVELTDGGLLPDGGCPPFQCAGRCGPVRNFCSGQVVQCGACTDGGVCNLATSRCGPVQITCGDLGAECGQLRNSCGSRLNCGACGSGLECDRNTNTCVPCSNATCLDLGYQCGDVWLGCGPFSNTTNCGMCPTNSVCNPLSHTCEPQCTPGTTQSICMAAGADCGTITDGCGGFVDCGGCPLGQSCGARGIGNRCDFPEFPDECTAANRECGPYTSACGGPTLNCGSCTPPDVCNAQGRCGPLCVTGSCGVEYAGRCGTGLDAGCGTTVNCSCSAGSFCDSTTAGVSGSCQVPSGCSQLGATGMPGAPCSNGPSPAFDAGAGMALTCGCVGQGVCTNGMGAIVNGPDAGTCCVNTAVCPANACGKSVINTCTGASIPCSCTAGSFCDTSGGPDAGVCVANRTCAFFGATGQDGGLCSNGPSPSFPQSPGTNLTCRCLGNARCYSDAGVQLPDGGSAVGHCCTPLTAAACPTNSCAPITDPCTGQQIACTCASGRHCNTSNNVCELNSTCLTYGADGGAGSTCSNGPSFSNGATPPTLLTCACTAANSSCTSAGTVVSGATRGTCCVNTNTTCSSAGGVGNRCNQSVTNSCTGASTTCGCNTQTFCGTSNTCEAFPFTCLTYGADGGAGNVCSASTSPAFPRFPGDTVGRTCACVGSVCTNSSGVVGNDGGTGTCCVNSNPTCSTAGGVGNRCNQSVTDSCTGASTTCGCNSQTYCGPSNTCIPRDDCSDFGANGTVDAGCSNGNSSSFPRFPGDSTGQTCACNSGLQCGTDTPAPRHVATGSQIGKCCQPAVCPTNTCAPVYDACTGQTLSCSCSSGFHCGGGVCEQDRTCLFYGADGGIGRPCSTVATSAFPDGPGDLNLQCGCRTTGGLNNNTCVGSSASVAGSCQCTPSAAANCSENGQPNGCGGTKTFTCPGATPLCHQGTCCAAPVCPAGAAGDACGQVTQCGQTVNCMCQQTFPNTSCGAVTPGVCGCKPKTQADCGVVGGLPCGQTSPNGCGGFVTCSC